MKKLLLVDDDDNLRYLLSSYLINEGFVINSVNSVQSALVIIKQDRPDLIISDIMMKQLDGYDLIKLLKLDSLLIDIPIIFLTAKGMTFDRIKGYNLGCHAYLTKPFNPQELLAIIKNIFYNIDLFKMKFIGNLHKKYDNHEIIKLLTYREKTILELILKGYMNKEIALKLNIGLRNVEKYVSRLLSKTKSRNRTELVQLILG
uniref:Hypothetical chloroplast protein 29 n=1 Tax=Membranoptera weeksiae TaxID=158720 RepID=A0A1N7T4B0_9FLOR|nr:hypothetical chloroplast protein 29 [Membranoptera weeksiae]AHZ94638.1 hypothetical chloroplast protein 29 [Membranoptera weeksiae]